jgi:hypothetical protein
MRCAARATMRTAQPVARSRVRSRHPVAYAAPEPLVVMARRVRDRVRSLPFGILEGQRPHCLQGLFSGEPRRAVRRTARRCSRYASAAACQAGLRSGVGTGCGLGHCRTIRLCSCSTAELGCAADKKKALPEGTNGSACGTVDSILGECHPASTRGYDRGRREPKRI